MAITLSFNKTGSYIPLSRYSGQGVFNLDTLRITYSGVSASDIKGDVEFKVRVRSDFYKTYYVSPSIANYLDWFPFDSLNDVKKYISDESGATIISVTVTVTKNDGTQETASKTIPFYFQRIAPYADPVYMPQMSSYTFDYGDRIPSSDFGGPWKVYAAAVKKSYNDQGMYTGTSIVMENNPFALIGDSNDEHISFDHISAKEFSNAGVKNGDKINLYFIRVSDDGLILDVWVPPTLSDGSSSTSQITLYYYEDLVVPSNISFSQEGNSNTVSVSFKAPASTRKTVRYVLDGYEYASYTKNAIIDPDVYKQKDSVSCTLTIPFLDVLNRNANDNSKSYIEIALDYSNSNYSGQISGGTDFVLSIRFQAKIFAYERATFRITKSDRLVRFDLNGRSVTIMSETVNNFVADKVAVVQYRNGDSEPMTFNSVQKVQVTNAENRLFEGDSLKVDTDSALITVNSYERHDIGDISNNYDAFFLKPGTNIVVCTYSDWVDTPPTFKLKYHEVFL